MGDADTALGGGRREFPSTCWSRLGRLRPGGPVDAEALEQLARGYWKPVYLYIRTRWAKTNEDAKDLTQDFFAWILESGFLAKADRERGRFRAFVKLALKSYLGMDERRTNAAKRGGATKILSIDRPPEDAAEFGIRDAAALSPDDLLDRAWKAELFGRAVERVRDELKGDGKELRFLLFRDYFLDESGDKDYRSVAAKYKISETDLANHLRAVKERFREILADLVSETVAAREDLQDELRALFGNSGTA